METPVKYLPMILFAPINALLFVLVIPLGAALMAAKGRGQERHA